MLNVSKTVIVVTELQFTVRSNRSKRSDREITLTLHNKVTGHVRAIRVFTTITHVVRVKNKCNEKQ